MATKEFLAPDVRVSRIDESSEAGIPRSRQDTDAVSTLLTDTHTLMNAHTNKAMVAFIALLKAFILSPDAEYETAAKYNSERLW